jgi:hypothetical protein
MALLFALLWHMKSRAIDTYINVPVNTVWKLHPLLILYSIWSDRGEGGLILVCKKGSFMRVLFNKKRGNFLSKYFCIFLKVIKK